MLKFKVNLNEEQCYWLFNTLEAVSQLIADNSENQLILATLDEFKRANLNKLYYPTVRNKFSLQLSDAISLQKLCGAVLKVQYHRIAYAINAQLEPVLPSLNHAQLQN